MERQTELRNIMEIDKWTSWLDVKVKKRNQLESYVFALKNQWLIMGVPELQKVRGRMEAFWRGGENIFVLAVLGLRCLMDIQGKYRVVN